MNFPEERTRMLVTTKGRYALRTLVDLAEHADDGYIPLKTIAQRQQLSDKYLESIVKTLVRDKVLVGARGKGGGYKLNASPADITVLSVLEQVENDFGCVEGLDDDHSQLPSTAQYRILDMWRELDDRIRGYLAEKTIADFVAADPGDFYVI